MGRPKTLLLYLLSFFFCFAGFMHLLRPEFFVAIIPPGLPSPEWLNVISGLAEITLGVFVLEPRVRWLAAWGLVVLLIAVYPAYVYMALANLGPEGPGTGNPWVNWGRLPSQALFVAWAWWYTRPEPEPAAPAGG